jgi:hypothetical protein
VRGERATMHDLSYGTVHSILTEDLRLVKKSARGVPKLLSTAKMLE